MDGDRMGDLVNGETINAVWETILHPTIKERIKGSGFVPAYAKLWREITSDPQTEKRLVTPAIHAAISEALGDFAMYGVAGIIEKYNGRLVYAGGDDVCAFLPLSCVVAAARKIRDYYTSIFRYLDEQGKSQTIDNGAWQIQPGKLSINLGIGKGISISAAILICHHKESLTQMLRRAHTLLDDVAKYQVGRDACALELRKRSGGDRLIAAKWDDPVWDALERLSGIAADDGRLISHSLLYRLEELKPGFDAMIDAFGDDEARLKKNVESIISAQLERSSRSVKDEDAGREIKKWLRQIALRKNKDGTFGFNAGALQIAAFMGGEDENE
jgi:CRISPR-associated protein Cmr2